MNATTIEIARKVGSHPAFDRWAAGLRIVPDSTEPPDYRVTYRTDTSMIFGELTRWATDGNGENHDPHHNVPAPFLSGVPDLDDAATVGVLLSQLRGRVVVNVESSGAASVHWPSADIHRGGATLGEAVALAWLATRKP